MKYRLLLTYTCIGHTNEFPGRYSAADLTPVLLSSSELFTFVSFQIKFCPLALAFRCGQNTHSIKYEIENTNIIPKGVNESNCINTNVAAAFLCQFLSVVGYMCKLRSFESRILSFSSAFATFNFVLFVTYSSYFCREKNESRALLAGSQ